MASFTREGIVNPPDEIIPAKEDGYGRGECYVYNYALDHEGNRIDLGDLCLVLEQRSFPRYVGTAVKVTPDTTRLYERAAKQDGWSWPPNPRLQGAAGFSTLVRGGSSCGVPTTDHLLRVSPDDKRVLDSLVAEHRDRMAKLATTIEDAKARYEEHWAEHQALVARIAEGRFE